MLHLNKLTFVFFVYCGEVSFGSNTCNKHDNAEYFLNICYDDGYVFYDI